MTPSHEELRAQLAELIAIPSVSADAAHAGDIVAAADWVAARIRAAGGEADVVPWNGGRPLVIGEIRASERPESAPTVLCYAHFDVQPPDPLELWESPPFELTKRDGRLYARGVADDKGNLFVLVEAARQLAEAGELPVNVRFGFDGEEEVGGDSIVQWVEQDERGADAAVILDGAMARRGQPVFYVGVRGMLYLHLRVRTGTTDMHSGMFGGRGSQRLARAHDRAGRRSPTSRRVSPGAAPRRYHGADGRGAQRVVAAPARAPSSSTTTAPCPSRRAPPTSSTSARSRTPRST